MRQQLVDTTGTTGGLGWQPLERVIGVSVRTVPIEPRRVQQAHHGGGSPDDNDFGDYVGSVVATPLAIPITTSAIPAVPLPAAVWLLGSALLGLAGIGRRRAA